MKAFEVGKSYFARSACDHECLFTYTVTSRTAKTVTLYDIKMKFTIGKRKITVIGNEETIHPCGRYSMAPIVRASNLYEL